MGGGSGGSETNTVDYAYNARMASISEEQNAWARNYFNMWEQHFKPYEIAQSQANMELLPLETNLYKGQLQSATELLPGQTEAAKKFLEMSTKGVDVNERMALATADTANAWKNVGDANLRENARLGVNPNSPGVFKVFRLRWAHNKQRKWQGQELKPAWAVNKKITTDSPRPLVSTPQAAYCRVLDL